MFFTGSLSAISQVPQPRLGLLPAVHKETFTNIATQTELDNLNVIDAKGNVFKNTSLSVLRFPSQGNYPTRTIPNNSFFSSDGSAFYRVRNREGNTRQVTELSNGVFNCDSNHGFINGQTVKVWGFTNSSTKEGVTNGPDVAFSNSGKLYYIANVTPKTFQIGGQDGTVYTDVASTSLGGYVHTQATSSYYPEAFERVIYSFPFSDNSLPVGGAFSILRKFQFRSIAAYSTCVWSVMFEFGEREDDIGPGSVGPNIKGYKYLPPALEQQVVITDVPNSTALGLRLINNHSGLSVSREVYSKTLPAIPGTTPTARDYILRVRIGMFDIENNNLDNSGHVAYLVTPGVERDSIGG